MIMQYLEPNNHCWPEETTMVHLGQSNTLYITSDHNAIVSQYRQLWLTVMPPILPIFKFMVRLEKSTNLIIRGLVCPSVSDVIYRSNIWNHWYRLLYVHYGNGWFQLLDNLCWNRYYYLVISRVIGLSFIVIKMFLSYVSLWTDNV